MPKGPRRYRRGLCAGGCVPVPRATLGWSAGWRGGFDGLPLAAGADLDALGLGLLGLGHHDLQHAVLERGLDHVRHHVGGQGDRAAEGAVAALDAMVLLLGGVVGEVPLALDSQQGVLDGDLEVVELDPWQLDAHQVGVLALGDVERRRPGRGAARSGYLPLAERLGSRLLIWWIIGFSSSSAPRSSSNGSHWVLSMSFSPRRGPHRRPPARGQRSPGACNGCTCRVNQLYSKQCSLSRT